jgi:hypothetical protein
MNSLDSFVAAIKKDFAIAFEFNQHLHTHPEPISLRLAQHHGSSIQYSSNARKEVNVTFHSCVSVVKEPDDKGIADLLATTDQSATTKPRNELTEIARDALLN